jgi:anti-anti-sigma factor
VGDDHQPPRLAIDPDAGVLHISGEIDLGVRDELVDRLKDPRVSVVDLSGVTFLDSTALGVLAQVDRVRPGELVFRRPTAQLRWLLRLSGLDELLTIEIA